MKRSVDIDWRARLRCAERGKAGREDALAGAPSADDDELDGGGDSLDAVRPCRSRNALLT